MITLVKEPDLRLKTRCKNVVRFGHRFNKIFKDMIELAEKYERIGLSGNQAGFNERFFIAFDGNQWRLFINPKIITEVGFQISKEGCLSLEANEMYEIKRPQKVIMEYQHISGKKLQAVAEDLMAACFCHEIDHLNGLTLRRTGTKIDETESIGVLI